MASPRLLKYYPEPNSLFGLSLTMRVGLLVIGSLAAFSLMTTFCALCLMIDRFASEYKESNHSTILHQYMILVSNLLFADFLQSLGFSINFHWVRVNGIFAPNGFCWAQAGLLHIGDLASGFFVLSIALHTLYVIVVGQRMRFGYFVASIFGAWSAALLLTLVGPLRFGKPFFTRAGSWCWISEVYDAERLWLHYLWIFINEFGCVAIYLGLFIYFRISLLPRGVVEIFLAREHARVNKVSMYMCLYPLLYCALTLPIATCRMVTLSGGQPTDLTLLVAGAFLTSGGWCNALVYTLTRRVLLQNHVTEPQEAELRAIRRQSQASDAIQLRHFEYIGNTSTGSLGDIFEPEGVAPRPRCGAGSEHGLTTAGTNTSIKLRPSGLGAVEASSLGKIKKHTDVDVIYSAATPEELAAKKTTDGIDWDARHPF